MAQISLLLFISAVIVCSAAPRTTVESNDIPQVHVGGDGVSASVGGYQAGAGLGGNLNGGPNGGLYAQAGIPGGTGAGAGLQGSASSGGSAYSGAGVGNGGGQSTGAPVFITVKGRRGHVRQRPAQRPERPADFYDNVFNIPISVLNAVNHLLGGGGGGATGAGGTAGGSASSSTKAVASDKKANAGSIASSITSTSANNAYSPGGKNFFDEIFNIPISALKSVNQLLNAKNQQRGEAQRQVPV